MHGLEWPCCAVAIEIIIPRLFNFTQADSMCVVTPENGALTGASMALKVAEALGVPGEGQLF